MSQHHGHSHGPPQVQQVAPGQGPQQQMRPAPDTVLQVAIEADFKPVSFEFADHEGRKNAQALCKEHKLHVCQKCGVDWQPLNALAAMFSAAPPDAILPPPNVVQPARTQAVNKTKEEGNNWYKKHQYEKAVNLYSAAMQIANSRPPWENTALAREEMSLVICNRSAGFYAAGDFLSSLLDAEAVIAIKRPWSKGHYRKGRALAALGDWQGAYEAIQLGLQFEPNNTDLDTFAKEIQTELERQQAAVENKENGTVPTQTTAVA